MTANHGPLTHCGVAVLPVMLIFPAVQKDHYFNAKWCDGSIKSHGSAALAKDSFHKRFMFIDMTQVCFYDHL